MIFVRLLRFVFHLLYHQLSWTYDLVAATVSAGLWTSWVRSVIADLPDSGRVLELGHGPGHLLSALSAAGRRPIGVDLSRQMGRQARRRLQRAGILPALVRADGRRLPFPDGTFRAVVATFPAEYIAEREAWASLSRILAPDGRIVVLLGAFPGGRHPLRIASRFLLRLAGGRGADVDAVALMAARFAFLDELGLVGEWQTRRVRSSETFILLVRHRGTV